MWSSRLFWKLFLAYGALYLALSVVFVILEGQRHQALVKQQARERLHNTASVWCSELNEQLHDLTETELQRRVRHLGLQTELRFTLVATDGTVIADSQRDPLQMENHEDRPELIAAAATGLGESIRVSPTLDDRMLYLALPVREGREVVALARVAMNFAALEEQLRKTQRYLWLMIGVVGLVAAPLSYVVVGHIVRPLSQFTASARAIAAGDYTRTVSIRSRDELGELGDAFRRMQEELAHRIDQLQQYAERLATVLGGMVEGVLAVDADARVILANDACRSLLGIKADHVVGRPLLETTRNLDIQAAVQEAMETRQPCEREIVSAGPERRVLQILATRLRTGPCSGVVVVLHDISELRRLENMRREFVANVSHELKTPLASIKAYAETLRLGAINDAEHNLRFVGKIEEDAQRLHQLIVDLLHLSRVESGRGAFDFARVSVQDVVHRCFASHQEIAEQKGIDLQIADAAEDVPVWADRQGLTTILDNLVDNALKYTGCGGTVIIRWRKSDDWAVLEVEDTGIGVDGDDQERIFERFYRIDKARSRELGGTGLGLAIVKHLAQAFSGEVTVLSEPGRGSLFALRLPLASQTEGAPAHAFLN